MRNFLNRFIFILLTCVLSAGILTPDADAKPRRRSGKPTTSKTSKAPAKTNPAPKQRTTGSIKKDQKQTIDEITETKRQISANKKKTQKTLDELESIQGKIIRQEARISLLNDSILSIEDDISILEDSIASMQAETDALRQDLKNTLRTMRARRKSVNNLTFVFSAPNFSAALKRVAYLKQLNQWRMSKIQHLESKIDKIKKSQTRLERLHEHRTGMLTQATATKQTLDQSQIERRKTVDKLRGESKELNAILSEKQRRIVELDRELDRIIAEEARKAEEQRKAEERKAEERRKQAEKKAKEATAKEAAAKARKEAEKAKEEKATTDKKQPETKPNPADKPKSPDKPKTSEKTKTPEKSAEKPKNDEKPVQKEAETDRKLTGEFSDNRGNLLFPVTGKYSIVGNFGRGQHKDISSVEVTNSGIDISASKGAKARAVFAGKVSSVFFMPGFQNVVIIRHGEYLTVYGGLTGLTVKKGSEVKAGTPLGTVYTDPSNNGRTILHFEVRQERKKLNPLEWVR